MDNVLLMLFLLCIANPSRPVDLLPFLRIDLFLLLTGATERPGTNDGIGGTAGLLAPSLGRMRSRSKFGTYAGNVGMAGGARRFLLLRCFLNAGDADLPNDDLFAAPRSEGGAAGRCSNATGATLDRFFGSVDTNAGGAPGTGGG